VHRDLQSGRQHHGGDVQALDLDGNAATIASTITMSVTSSNTNNFQIGPGATLTIDGTATPPNQSTTTFTITDAPRTRARSPSTSRLVRRFLTSPSP